MPISSGTHFIGPGFDYDNWGDFCRDLASALTGDLRAIQVADTYETTDSPTPSQTDLGSYTMILESAVPHRGDPRSGFISTLVVSNIPLWLHVRGTSSSKLIIRNLNWDGQDWEGSSGGEAPFIFLQADGGYTLPPTFIHDVIIAVRNADFYHRGIEVEGKAYDFRLWNYKAVGLRSDSPGSWHAHGLYFRPASHSTSDVSFIENCSFINCDEAIRMDTKWTNIPVNNCVAFNTGYTSFNVISDQPGNNNVSRDGSAATFDGEDNLWDYDGVTNSPDVNDELETVACCEVDGVLRLALSSTLLKSAGRAPTTQSEERITPVGAEGNAIPGTDGEYSVGADEFREIFPGTWGGSTRMRIAPKYLPSTTEYYVPLVITQDAPIPDRFWDEVEADGKDIRLTSDAEGTQPLPCWVELIDTSSKKLTIWTKWTFVPGEDVIVYLWWGQASCSYTPQAEIDKGEWWVYGRPPTNDDYTVAQHCKDPTSGVDASAAFDSTRGKWTGLLSGSSKPIRQSAGPWGWQYAFGVNRYLEMPNYDAFGSFKYDPTQNAPAVTLEAVIQRTGSTSKDQPIISIGGDGYAPRSELKLDTSFDFAVRARAPDSGSTQSASDGEMPAFPTWKHVVAVISPDTDKIRFYVDGVFDSEASVSFGDSYFTFGFPDQFFIGNNSDGPSQSFDGRINFVRLYLGEMSAERAKLAADNTINYLDFWEEFSVLSGTGQGGSRSFKMSNPTMSSFEVEDTDFYMEYINNAGVLGLILHGVWDTVSDDPRVSLAKRQAIEDYIKELRHDWQGRVVDLEVDGSALLTDVTLVDVGFNSLDTNAGVIYELTFELSLSGNKEIARTLEFGSESISAAGFTAEYISQDRTAFKDVFRAAPVRVPSGPPRKQISIVGLAIKVSNHVSGLLRKRDVEAFLKHWAFDLVGTAAELKLDGVSEGTVHLLAADPSDLELPDAIVMDLQFATEYGE